MHRLMLWGCMCLQAADFARRVYIEYTAAHTAIRFFRGKTFRLNIDKAKQKLLDAESRLNTDAIQALNKLGLKILKEVRQLRAEVQAQCKMPAAGIRQLLDVQPSIQAAQGLEEAVQGLVLEGVDAADTAGASAASSTQAVLSMIAAASASNEAGTAGEEGEEEAAAPSAAGLQPIVEQLLQQAGLPAEAAPHECMLMLKAILDGSEHDMHSAVAAACERLAQRGTAAEVPVPPAMDITQLQSTLGSMLEAEGLNKEETSRELDVAAAEYGDMLSATKEDKELGPVQLIKFPSGSKTSGYQGYYHTLMPQSTHEPSKRCMAWALRKKGHKESGLCSTSNPRYRIEVSKYPGYFFVCGHHHEWFDDFGHVRKLYRVNKNVRKKDGQTWRVEKDTLVNGGELLLWANDKLTAATDNDLEA